MRFNARKTTIGKYLSTSIYEFSMKCHLCQHLLVICTDPETCDYTMHKGLSRIRAAAYDDQLQIKGLEKEPNAFEKLESAVIDKQNAKVERPRLEAIMAQQEEKKDDFTLN